MFTESDGRQLAGDMFRELRRDWAEADYSDVPDDQMGEAMLSREPEILRRYLATVRENPAVERGFLCFLSNFLGSELQAFPDVFIQRQQDGGLH